MRDMVDLVSEMMEEKERKRLRDYFAGQALAGALTIANAHEGTPWTSVAGFCYEIADAMLAEREENTV